MEASQKDLEQDLGCRFPTSVLSVSGNYGIQGQKGSQTPQVNILHINQHVKKW